MLSQPSSSQPEEEETLSTAEQLKQKAGQYNQRATDLREQLNNNPNGKSHEEALALQDEVTRLNADTQQLQEDLNEAARAGELTGSDLTDALYDVDDATNRAKNLRPEAARQVQYASPNGQQAREVAELVVPGFGTLTDAKDIAQLLSTGQYGAAAGMTGLAIASIFPLARAARKVGRTSDAAEDVASAAKRVDEVPGNSSTVNSALHAKHVDELAALNRQGLLSELSQNGIKHNPENIVDIRKMQDGKIAFLETGNKQAGLEHILVQHQQDFANVGIHPDQIPDAVMTAVTQGKVIGYQGKNQGRTIYDVVFNDTRHQISVTVSDNGFVVGANPQSRLSPYIME